MYKHILLPVDGSPLSEQALEQGLAFARDIGAKVTVLTVIEPFEVFTPSPELMAEAREAYDKRANEDADQRLQAAADKAAGMGVDTTTRRVKGNHPHRQIIDTAEQAGCDLVVMASHGRRGVSALLLGSVTQKVLTHSSVPVLVIRPG